MKIEKYVNTVVYGDGGNDLRFLAALLQSAALAYGAGVGVRRALYRRGVLKTKRLPCAVVSVGNITAGGVGKTPMTIYLAEQVRRMGYKAAVVSRGYGGAAEKTGGIVSDGVSVLMDSKRSGDEPYMMARRLRNIPVVIGADRYSAGMLAVREFDPQVIILDDAFQHIRLNRDIDLLLLDYQKPFGNNHLLPRGPLRESPAGLSRVDAVIFTRADTAIQKGGYAPANLIPNRPVFKSRHEPTIRRYIEKNTLSPVGASVKNQLIGPAYISSKRVFLFSGIADNSRFKETVEKLGGCIVGTRFFPDHHAYSARDMQEIQRSVMETSPDLLMTTEKDYSRISGNIVWPADLMVLDVSISFTESEEAAFLRFIEQRLLKQRMNRL